MKFDVNIRFLGAQCFFFSSLYLGVRMIRCQTEYREIFFTFADRLLWQEAITADE